MDPRLATLKSVSFYLPLNVSTLNQCRKLSCGTLVCKHFASYQGYPNYRWDLILHPEESIQHVQDKIWKKIKKEKGTLLVFIERKNKAKIKMFSETID
jgi:hypothetical protein